MKVPPPVNEKNVATVLRRLADQIASLSPERRKAFCAPVDMMLNDLLVEFAFGPDGRLDPRNDDHA